MQRRRGMRVSRTLTTAYRGFCPACRAGSSYVAMNNKVVADVVVFLCRRGFLRESGVSLPLSTPCVVEEFACVQKNPVRRGKKLKKKNLCHNSPDRFSLLTRAPGGEIILFILALLLTDLGQRRKRIAARTRMCAGTCRFPSGIFYLRVRRPLGGPNQCQSHES